MFHFSNYWIVNTPPLSTLSYCLVTPSFLLEGLLHRCGRSRPSWSAPSGTFASTALVQQGLSAKRLILLNPKDLKGIRPQNAIVMHCSGGHDAAQPGFPIGYPTIGEAQPLDAKIPSSIYLYLDEGPTALMILQQRQGLKRAYYFSRPAHSVMSHIHPA